MLSETRMDRENSCEGMQLFAPKTKQINLIFSGSPAPASAKAVLDNYPGKSTAVGLSCSLPDYRHYSPSLTNCLRPLCTARLSKQVCDRRRNKWLLDWMAACQSWICFPLLQSYVFMVYVLLCWGVFFCSHTVLPKWSIVWGLIFFSPPPSPHVMLYFSSIPCLPVRSTPLSYVCCVCMDRLMANFAGNCD